MQLAKRLTMKFGHKIDCALRGKYLQGHFDSIHRWQRKLQGLCHVNRGNPVPSVQAFKAHIREDPVAKMYLQGGLDQIPYEVKQFVEDQNGNQVQQKPRLGVSYGYTWEKLLDQWAQITRKAPQYQDAAIVGVPFYATVIDLLNTPFGRIFFSMDDVDRCIKPIFNAYGDFLDTPASLLYLTTDSNGWLSSDRINYDDFICDTSKPHFGFISWHDWFHREIRVERRPMNPDPNVIVNNSEYYPNFHMPYKNVQWHDKYWLKDQRYSLEEMLGLELPQYFTPTERETYRNAFEGGSVFQGFLNPWCYHRWRAPVSGLIEKCYSIGNSYYAGNPSLSTQLLESYIQSQPLLTMTSVRQIYIIKADNPNIGRVAVIQIGMAEVSGIKNKVLQNTHINKGDLLGYFRFGGSSHAIIFDRNAKNLRFSPNIQLREFDPITQTDVSVKQNVRTDLAYVGPEPKKKGYK